MRVKNLKKPGFGVLFTVLILLMIPQIVSARGVGNGEEAYENALQLRFEEVIDAVGAGELGSSEAIAQLNEIREQHRYRKTEQHMLMESCINSVAKGEMTPEQAREKTAEQKRIRSEERVREESRVRESDPEGDQIREETREREEVQKREGDSNGSGQNKSGN